VKSRRGAKGVLIRINQERFLRRSMELNLEKTTRWEGKRTRRGAIIREGNHNLLMTAIGAETRPKLGKKKKERRRVARSVGQGSRVKSNSKGN